MNTPSSRKTVHSSERIVNLGDSITDGQTYALLLEQALRKAGKAAPRFYGAGVGGDVAAGMLARLDRDVLPYRPTLVMFNGGINDLARGTKLEDYEKSVRAIAERLHTEKVPLMILTTTNIRGAVPPRDEALCKINAILHQIALDYDRPVAEVYQRMEEARAEGIDLWEADGSHLNFAGYRVLTRAVLDAMGHTDVAVPPELELEVLPGIIPQWKVLPVTEDRPRLDAAAVAALQVDDRWNDYRLPEEKPVEGWWWNQERRRGIALSLAELFGPAKRFIAVADYNSPRARAACLNLGGGIGGAWLNGQQYSCDNNPPRGWHPGNCRIPVRLQKGTNRIVLETSGKFFLSITDDCDW